jgi:hypothetical protein
MENKYYIYAHTIASHGLERPFGEIFYIGRGCRRRAYVKSRRSSYWNNIINKYGYNVHFFETGLTNEEANLAEKRYIKAIGREDIGKGTLVNFTDGGEGLSGHIQSEEHKRKIGEASKGRIMSLNTKEKLLKSKLGKSRSEQTKKKISNSLKGQIAWNKGLPGTRLGVKESDLTKQKKSEANKKAWAIKNLNK